MAIRVTYPFLALSLAILFAHQPFLAGAEGEYLATGVLTNVSDHELAAQATELFRQLPAPAKRYASLSQTEVERTLLRDANYAQLVREKLEGHWFAALVAQGGEAPFAVQGKFDTWRGLVEFLAKKNALVEVWAWPEGINGAPRRIPAPELGELQRQQHERPTFVTVTYPDPATGMPVTQRVEFGFQAAEYARASNASYEKHRRIQLLSRKILDARNANGQPDAMAQWNALQSAVNAGEYPLLEMPSPPRTANDFLVACEYTVDDRNNFRAVVRLYRDSEIQRRVTGDLQFLVLTKPGDKAGREVLAYRQVGVSDQLKPVANPIPGQDAIELRVKDPGQPDVRKWAVLEFGAPELLKQSSLAYFSLVNAYLEKERKALALKQANLGLIVEPIIAGLNIGCGVSGVGFPVGAAVRLTYNTLVVPRFLPNVPNVKQMRELFQLMAARDRNPQIKLKPLEFLNGEDIATLREDLKHLTDAEVTEYLRTISDEDIRAMLRIAKMLGIDAKLTNLLSIIAGVGLVTGWTEQPGVAHDLFNNIYVSVTGEISMNYIIAVLAGEKVATPLSGVSLYDLARGNGPPEAWLQYLNFTVDIRALANTVVRLFHKGLANKELKAPFPYAPKMTDLAAYEFRIFGYPVLIFYKRGLIKDDGAAFQNDYAYGLLGVKIVEHFPTRESFEAEIRTGHVVPLGYVRVPSVKGGWKESNLAVFAHQIPEGKYRGKTSLIVYGLKAFVEHSELVQRERQRFVEFEKGLRQGAVIEQLMANAPGSTSVSRALEPVIHVGADTGKEIYDPLLARLLELRRVFLRAAWNLPPDESEREYAGTLRAALAAQGIDVPEGNPLVDIDAFNSSFIYRRRVNDREEKVKVTRIPSLEDIARELQKAEDGKLIEEARRDAAAGKSAGVVLRNQVLEVDRHLEVGPLLRTPEGQVQGAGLISGPKAVGDFFTEIERLPVVDRARLRFNHFSATVVELDTKGDGVKEKVFLTLEFPVGEFKRVWTNPTSGERETLVFSDGLWRQTITDSRIVEIEYDGSKVEMRSRTYVNQGRREVPERGELIEETRTLESWFRDLSQPGLDPYQPVVSKLRINYVTGQLSRETYGLFPLPVEVADDQYVTRSRYDGFGVFNSASVVENGQSPEDFQRPATERVLRPIAGRERYYLTRRQPDVPELLDLSAAGYQFVVERTDLLKGVTRAETIDSAHSGRKIAEQFVDSFDGTRSFTNTLTLEYEDKFHYGLIPARTLTASGPSAGPLVEDRVVDYNPLQRRLTAVETDHTGATRTNIWDYRWSSPVEIESPQRRTVQRYNRDETAVTGETTLRSNGEILQSFSGEYDATQKSFRVARLFWYRPGIPGRSETNTYSAFGRLVATRIGDTFEVRPEYDADGIETSRRTLRRDPATGLFSIPHRQDHSYRWQSGECRAHVRTWLEGVPYDEYQTITDAEGRTIVDGIRQWPELELRTVITYDGGSDRVLEAEERQNDQIRAHHRALGEVPQADGSYRLRVEVRPFWGLVRTNSFRLGDPFGRTTAVDFENGNQDNRIEWFADTAIARVAESSDRHGRATQRFVRQPNVGVESGVPYDRVTRYQLSPWGTAGLEEDVAVARGTEVALFQVTPDARIFFDLTKPYESAFWSVNPRAGAGVMAIVGGVARSNIIAISKSQVRQWQDPARTNQPTEQVMESESIDLRGLFYHKVSRRVADRAGKLLEEQIGRIENLGPQLYSDSTILARAASAEMTRKSSYRYEPGWLFEQGESATGHRQLTFSVTKVPTPPRDWSVNDTGWRDWLTQIEGRQAGAIPLLEAKAEPPLFRVLHHSRLIETNPYLPDVTNVWTAFTSTDFDDKKSRLFDAEVIFDPTGRMSASDAQKINSLGHTADKVSYQLPVPSPETWKTIAGTMGTGDFQLKFLAAAGPENLSAFDFVAFYVDTPTDSSVELDVKDAAARHTVVSSGRIADQSRGISFWPVDPEKVQWLPDGHTAKRASVVASPVRGTGVPKAFAISVPELARTGLNIRELTSMDLTVSSVPEAVVRVSPLYRLAHRGVPLIPHQAGQMVFDDQRHSSGLETFTQTKLRRSADEIRTQRGQTSLLRYNGVAVGVVNPNSQTPYYPIVHFTDAADPDQSRPLYSLATEDGKFRDYYRTAGSGNAQVFTAVSGFETPILEVYRSRVLDDELSPGILAFGRSHPLTIPIAKGDGVFSTAIARLRNRCAASIFTLAGDLVLQPLTGVSPYGAQFTRLAREMGPAESQAAAINELPTLAGALLHGREVPWQGVPTDPAFTIGPPASRNASRRRLQVLEGYFTNAITDSSTKLIPTSPGSDGAPYVDTVQEGAIIELAVKLNETAVAWDLLAFYLEKSEGGNKALHSAYDARTGASLTLRPKPRSDYRRPIDADEAAEAQLAIAQAAFCLGAATGNSQALEFGRNLIKLLLEKFREKKGDSDGPRGISELAYREGRLWNGIMMWPEAKSFRLKSNARAYLILSRLAESTAIYPLELEWKRSLAAAAAEQAEWLTNRIQPHTARTGVVPKGLFEIQDVHSNTHALAAERWTAADDWLAFIEAVDRIGVSKELSRSWLENLARAHGVTVQGKWGLDWSIAVDRPDAISTELTARFARVASQVGYEQAASFARQNLARIFQTNGWPVVVTTAGTNSPLPTGQASWIYPSKGIKSGRGQGAALAVWPETLMVDAELAGQTWPTNVFGRSDREGFVPPPGDIAQFFWIAADFYFAIVAVTLFWWLLSAARRRRPQKVQAVKTGPLVPDPVMEKAEERWSRRVLGMRPADKAERSRYSNGAIEQNFHMQLRATYKLVLEWRRMVNGWSEDDPRLVEDGTDEWLNGMDEFAVMVGIYSRWVVKAGKKDGRHKADVLQENEDSNHVWSRLVIYFSESHLGLLGQIKEFKAHPDTAAFVGVNDQIELVLRTLGVRARSEPFDARAAFDVPGQTTAFDLLVIQLPGASLPRIVEEMERRLGIPADHVVSFVKGFKAFKEREQLLPVHPYLLEMAKVLPHFLLMGLAALIWYNDEIRGLSVIPDLKKLATTLALDWQHSAFWALPLFAGFALSAIAHYVEEYRYRWLIRSAPSSRIIDASVTSLFNREATAATPTMRTGRRWNPLVYQRTGWILRAVGMVGLAINLFQSEASTFATFMFVKGVLAVILLIEAAATLVPVAVSRFSMWLEDRVSANPNSSALSRFINQLNLVPTRPASLIWLSLKYHFQPSVPTGGGFSMFMAATFFVIFNAVFFVVGSYMGKQALFVWFQEAYGREWNLGLAVGGLLFWTTMYLLRFGLFVLAAAVASALSLYPLKVLGGLIFILCLGLQLFGVPLGQLAGAHPALSLSALAAGLTLVAFEAELGAWLRGFAIWRNRVAKSRVIDERVLEEYKNDPNRALGIVYMSGDDLSFLKLTPELLMTRTHLLRDQLGSTAIGLLSTAHSVPDDQTLSEWFRRLYELEKKHDVTLWHPMQLVISNTPPRLRPESGLNLVVDDVAQREQILAAWHIRRWLVTMMSAAGHAQDTAINLVDIALRVAGEGLGPRIAFYLIQNKYDNNDNNRPSQLAYDKGELGQRNKLARLFMEIAPGSRAYNINDWTPFGFKAGGLVGMDLVHEESMKLTNMLVLDRNANAHDLDSLMADLKLALCDPGTVIVIPGRSTTNTLTPLGQSSQLVEEGQRAFTRGVMALGGMGAETLGTGWGNIQAIYYGRVQRALCDPDTSKMPLTRPAQRGAPFGDRWEGLIGFGPHAVGISEDIWGVTQAAHSGIALGLLVKFRRSRTFWHKIRESWSHAEWFSAFPRWSGGYLQMMLDPMMQRINDEGPLPVFAKELRANGGRFFLTAPFALFSILAMPLAIIWNVSPFVQILILLWNLGFVLNQVLTALGLVACLESTGFHRVTAVIGAGCAGIAVAFSESLRPFAVPLVGLGFLAGGFMMGLGRWLYWRGRDVILFGPQLVIHALGQVVRQSLEFVLSGASANDAKAVNVSFRAWVGPREDRPFEGYQNFLNLRTVVWGVGLLSLALNLFALMNLDFLNALLLLPSLMFSVSTLIGPFIMSPKPGRCLGRSVWVPKVSGWIGSLAFYGLVAGLVARGGWPRWLGVLLFAACFAGVLRAGLKYWGYPRRLRHLTQLMARRIASGGMAAEGAKTMAQNIVRSLGGDVEKTRAALQKTGLAEEHQTAVTQMVRDQLLPHLKKPLTDLQTGDEAKGRFVCEFNRSFVLGLFTFVWFFIVPIPGLLVFTAPDGYRFVLPLAGVLAFSATVLGAILTGYCASLLLERLAQSGVTGEGLLGQMKTQYRRFQSLVREPGGLTPLQSASLYALFTDVQTYIDQRGYAYARQTLRMIEQTLTTISNAR